MINASIENITINEDDLYNRIKAYGPGDGINRAAITREDASSIAQYGVREEVFDVPTATDFDDFVAKVNARLEIAKDPVTEIEITFFYDTDKGPGGQIFEGTALTHDGNEIDYYRFGDEREIKRGDTIRIVSRSLGINTTGVIEELDWEPGQVSLSIGSKRYNLLDVVFEEESRRERQEAAFGIERPISFRAESGNPGCVVASNPYVSPRTVGVEIYGSQAEGFTPDRDTLLYKGVSSRVEFQQLIPPNTYYFRARAYDVAGNFSEFTDEVSADAGYLTRNGLEPNAVDNSRLDSDAVREDNVEDGAVSEPKVRDGAISKDKIDANAVTADKIDANAVTADKIKTGELVIDDEGEGDDAANRIVVSPNGDDKVAMGYINGRPGVPSNVDYGFWGALGTGVFIQGSTRFIDAGTGVGDRDIPSNTYFAGDYVILNVNTPPASDYIINSPFEVPPGKVWVVRTNLSSHSYNYNDMPFAIQTLLFFPQVDISNGGFTQTFSINAGSYSSISTSLQVKLVAVSTITVSSNAKFNYSFDWDIFEVDA